VSGIRCPGCFVVLPPRGVKGRGEGREGGEGGEALLLIPVLAVPTTLFSLEPHCLLAHPPTHPPHPAPTVPYPCAHGASPVVRLPCRCVIKPATEVEQREGEERRQGYQPVVNADVELGEGGGGCSSKPPSGTVVVLQPDG
jgi:hypothetical protein